MKTPRTMPGQDAPPPQSGNENIDRVRSLALSNRRLTVRMIAEELGLGKSSVHTILTEHLDMKKVCAKIVPKLLTPEQKLRRKECCADCKTSEESDEFMERVITGDESWIYDSLNANWCCEGRNLGAVTTIKSEMTSLLKGLREAELQGCFQQWKQRWDKCIVSNGEYFEGDHTDVS